MQKKSVLDLSQTKGFCGKHLTLQPLLTHNEKNLTCRKFMNEIILLGTKKLNMLVQIIVNGEVSLT